MIAVMVDPQIPLSPFLILALDIVLAAVVFWIIRKTS